MIQHTWVHAKRFIFEYTLEVVEEFMASHSVPYIWYHHVNVHAEESFHSVLM